MTSTRAHRSPRPGAWLALPWLLAACSNVLGIEERKVDTADSYPAQGYAGCRPGECGGCLTVHLPECQARSACAEAIENDDCAGCVCLSCEQEVIACQVDPGCSSIWQCLRETRCDLSERAQGNCLQACGSIIQANGGVTGEAFRAAAEIRSCAASSTCLTCLAPQVQQSSRECTQSNGCLDCDACFDQCLCSGERFGECQRLCATEDAPPAACSEADACGGCTSCFDACACAGGSYDSCVEQCTTPDPDPDPDPAPECSAASSCVSCTDCVSQCTCSTGNTSEICQGLCAPPVNDQCLEDPRGTSSACQGCQGCIAQCTCPGDTLEYCRGLCQEADCCGSPGSCGGDFSNCLCTQSGASCYAQYFGSCDSAGACDKCACEKCPAERGMCNDTPGCSRTFDCMRATDCKGSECLERCRFSGDPPQAFAYAEALWACYRGNSCGCETSPPPPVTCSTLQGDVQCQPYVGNVGVQACCSGVPYTEPAGTQLGLVTTTDPCGLHLSVFVRGAKDCEPRAQPSPPRYGELETCSSRAITGVQLYGGALLKGCCRPDHTCGYYDDVTGLGCLSTTVFGEPEQACP